MAEVDFIEEIHIAQYWRKQLGEYEYVYYNPDDLRRWYIALETRGPDEIRSYLKERAGRYPPTGVTGVVSRAPHPPLSVVELWLASHETVHTRQYWLAAALFGLTIFYFIPNLQSCMNLKSVDRLATHPPQMHAPLQAGSPGPPPSAASTLPNPGPAPASVASPPTGSQSGGSQQH
jgi:hypothetical protein